MIKKCINCGLNIKIKEDMIKYKCPRCKTEYEYIDCVDTKTELIESVEEANVIEEWVC